MEEQRDLDEALDERDGDVAPAIDTDHVTLRRLLVDHGHLERSPDGGTYRVGFPARPVIFDLEVAFLFPWAVSLGDIGLLGFWSMVVFLAILTVGFVYEWKVGAMDW